MDDRSLLDLAGGTIPFDSARDRPSGNLDPFIRAGLKFPATIPSVYVRVYAQAQHIDLDYYDAVAGADAVLDTHRHHLATWHA